MHFVDSLGTEHEKRRHLRVPPAREGVAEFIRDDLRIHGSVVEHEEIPLLRVPPKLFSRKR